MNEPIVRLRPEVQTALSEGRGVVALESTIVTHGMPYPTNVETASRVEQTVREEGATPATVALIDGEVRAGLSQDELERAGRAGASALKVSRRDLPFAIVRPGIGGTTVAATMIIARMAGIEIFATGGIGGVHRGAERTFDVSADLQELAHGSVNVVCAGFKSILDLGLTLEYLETHGVAVVGFGTDRLPAFYCETSDFAVPYRVDTIRELSAVIEAKKRLSLRGGMVIANPIPPQFAMDRDRMEGLIQAAIAEASTAGISGKEMTPFLLSRIAHSAGREALEANTELVVHNARIAARIAVSLAGAEKR